MARALLSLAAVAAAVAAAPPLVTRMNITVCHGRDPAQFWSLPGDGTVRTAAIGGGGDYCATNDAGTSVSLTPCVAGEPSQIWAVNTTTTSTFSNGAGAACVAFNIQGGPGIVAEGATVALWPCDGPAFNDDFLIGSPFGGALSPAYTSASNSTWPGLCVQAVAAPLPLPTADVLAWQENPIACFIHYNMATMAGSQGCSGNAAPPPLSAWQPTALDTDAWIATGVAMGCSRFIYVAKHGCGFVAWNSSVPGDVYNYTVAYAPAPYNAVDVVASFVASAKKAGVGFGFYYSVVSNAYLNVNNGVVGPNPLPGQQPITQAGYDNLVVAHLTELWSAYGPLAEIWFDGGVSDTLKSRLSALMNELQPHVVAFQAPLLMPSPIRWVGTEAGIAPDPTWCTCDPSADGAGDPSSSYWYPAETDFTLQNGDNWFFNEAAGVHSAADLRTMFESSIGHNTAIIVDIAPQPNGTVPAAQAAAAAGIGAYWRACYDSPPVASGSGNGTTLTITVPGGASATVDRVVLQEDISQGQRVRAYTVTALAGGASVPVSSGTSIGSMKIDVLPTPLAGVTALTVTVTASVAQPIFRGFAARACAGMAAAHDADWAAFLAGRRA